MPRLLFKQPYYFFFIFQRISRCALELFYQLVLYNLSSLYISWDNNKSSQWHHN